MEKSKEQSTIVVAHHSPMHNANGRGAMLRGLSSQLMRKGHRVTGLSLGKRSEHVIEDDGYFETVLGTGYKTDCIKQPEFEHRNYTSYLFRTVNTFINQREAHNSEGPTNAMIDELKKIKPSLILASTPYPPDDIDILHILVDYKLSAPNVKLVTLGDNFSCPDRVLANIEDTFVQLYGNPDEKELKNSNGIRLYFKEYLTGIYDMVLMKTDTIVFNAKEDFISAMERIPFCCEMVLERLLKYEFDGFRKMMLLEGLDDPNSNEEQFRKAKSEFVEFISNELSVKLKLIQTQIGDDQLDGLVSGVLGIAK